MEWFVFGQSDQGGAGLNVTAISSSAQAIPCGSNLDTGRFGLATTGFNCSAHRLIPLVLVMPRLALICTCSQHFLGVLHLIRIDIKNPAQSIDRQGIEEGIFVAVMFNHP